MRRLIFWLLCLSMPWAAHAEMALRDALSAPAQVGLSNAVSRADLSAFYAARDFRPAWALTEDGAEARTDAYIASVENMIAYHGLERAPYHLDEMSALLPDKSDEARQKLEIAISASMLRLAMDLRGDTLDLAAFYPGWNFQREKADVPSGINQALDNGDLTAFFVQLSPQCQPYRDLASALKTYRDLEKQGGWPPVETGEPLRPHEKDPRVVQIRARLKAEGYAPAEPTAGQEDVYDEALAQTVAAYQRRNGLTEDGHAGIKTIEAMNVPVAARIGQIRANMERWRHMPERFPPARRAQINIPDFTIDIVDGNQTYRGIVVVGRTDRPTPFINSRIANMLINPSWHVPVSIARKDILPKLRRDKHYLERQNIVIEGRGEDPSGVEIDWKNMKDEDFSYQLRQEPGDWNSLGSLKFNFANPFDVYMHGTPHQELFAKAERAFSSGCVRLEDPDGVGAFLLAHNKDGQGPWDEARIDREIDSDQTHFVPLRQPMPVYFLYWTVFLDRDGNVNFRKDIYGYDQMLIDRMKSAEILAPPPQDLATNR